MRHAVALSHQAWHANKICMQETSFHLDSYYFRFFIVVPTPDETKKTSEVVHSAVKYGKKKENDKTSMIRSQPRGDCECWIRFSFFANFQNVYKSFFIFTRRPCTVRGRIVMSELVLQLTNIKNFSFHFCMFCWSSFDWLNGICVAWILFCGWRVSVRIFILFSVVMTCMGVPKFGC